MITTAEIKQFEKKALESGITLKDLMDNAGKAVCDAIEDKMELKDKRVLIICYHGNNGGDGFSAASYISKKTPIDILFIGDEDKLSDEAAFFYEQCLNNENIMFTGSPKYINFGHYDIIIDAILGIGSKRSLKNEMAEIINLANQNTAFRVSIDNPTGIDPDTGKIDQTAFEADLIVTFWDIKKGLEQLKDKCVVANISYTKQENSNKRIIDIG